MTSTNSKSSPLMTGCFRHGNFDYYCHDCAVKTIGQLARSVSTLIEEVEELKNKES